MFATSALKLMDTMKRRGPRTLYASPSSSGESAVLEEYEQRGWLRRTARHLQVID